MGRGEEPTRRGEMSIEYVNFAFITKSGVPPGPPGPLLQNNSTFTPNADTLFYNPGDVLRVVLQDTTDGLKITITDLTTGETGFMTASATNGFAEILFDPNGHTCSLKKHNLPTNFHPMNATSTEHTRVPWAAHSYNVAFSDEIGHFEYCSAVSSEGGACTSSGASDPPGPGLDENFCFDAAFAASFGLIPIDGCLDTVVRRCPLSASLAGNGPQHPAGPAIARGFGVVYQSFVYQCQRSAGELQQGGVRSGSAAHRVRYESAMPAPFFQPCRPQPWGGLR
jgi:hypothetical protein